MSNTLLPCPFCGGEAYIKNTPNYGSEKPRLFVTCYVCGIETPRIARNEKEAIAAWNRRAGKDINVATNADRIRSMNDEELARFLARVENRRSAAGNGAMWNGMTNALDWLQQPVKEVEP